MQFQTNAEKRCQQDWEVRERRDRLEKHNREGRARQDALRMDAETLAPPAMSAAAARILMIQKGRV